ncbi:McrB family protein [Scytonema sp. NUACC26]|uniref:McrB family protein n=1 Tax=Scytonema sp. NUACC26 TaxID=3140176 RepID=UPI0034DB8450
MLKEDKKAEFVKLFQEFVAVYVYTPHGLNRKKIYIQKRQYERRYVEAIVVDSTEEPTQNLLLRLLPNIDSIIGFQPGDYIHIDSSITGHLRTLISKFQWTKIEYWPLLAQAIIRFLQQCYKNSNQLLTACTEFVALPYTKNFQMPTLTPILNLVCPDIFFTISNVSRQVINYFANTLYSHKLIEYPFINLTANELISELAKEMNLLGVPAMQDDDLLDMFSYWLVVVKRYNLISKVNQQIKKSHLQLEYTLSQCAKEISFDEAKLQHWIRIINRKGQAVLYGSPGTGKTFIAEKLAKHLIAGGNGFSELVQFHPAYSYEDFIQGIRPQNENGQLKYSLATGRFLEFCQEAEKRQGICVLIIDEINRANLSQVFGELMYLLEYRDREISLAGGNKFRLPSNVRIIGTMNTADRSIALVDYALRRRFAFIEVRPNYNILEQYHQKTAFPAKELRSILEELNKLINDKNYEIGISFFLTETLSNDIEDIWCMEIEPYLEEYFFNQLEKVDEFRWERIKQRLPLY